MEFNQLHYLRAPKYISLSCVSKMIALYQNVVNCQTHSVHAEVEDLFSRCTNGSNGYS